MLPTSGPLERQPYGSTSTSDSKHYRRSVDWRDSGIFIDTESDCSSKRSSLDVCLIDSRLQSEYDLMVSKDQEGGLSCFGNSNRTAESCHSNLSVGSNVSEDGSCKELMNKDLRYSIDKITFQDDDGDTILHLAVVGCSFNTINDLVKVYAQEDLLNMVNNMMHSALHVAVMTHRTDIVELFIKFGAKYNLRDRRGNTCLHIACQHGHIQTVIAILESVVSLQEKDVTENQDLCDIQSLVEMRNFDGQTCLHLAASKGHRHILKLLINNYKTDMNLVEGKSGDTILHMAIKNHDLELVSFILRQLDGFCNSSNYAGYDPLKTLFIIEQSADEQSVIHLQKIKSLIIEKIESCTQKDQRNSMNGPNLTEEGSDFTDTSDDEP